MGSCSWVHSSLGFDNAVTLVRGVGQIASEGRKKETTDFTHQTSDPYGTVPILATVVADDMVSEWGKMAQELWRRNQS